MILRFETKYPHKKPNTQYQAPVLTLKQSKGSGGMAQ